MDAPLVVRWHTDYGHVSAIVFDVGSKYIHLLPMENRPLRIRKLLIRDRRYLTPLSYKDKQYTVARAKRHFKQHADTFGITKSAKKVLTSI